VNRLTTIANELNMLATDIAGTIHTSSLIVVTTPARWGYEIVDIIYGEIVSTRRNQTIAIKGDILRDRAGKLWEFQERRGSQLKVAEYVLPPMTVVAEELP
jgi:hypothetical protein